MVAFISAVLLILVLTAITIIVVGAIKSRGTGDSPIAYMLDEMFGTCVAIFLCFIIVVSIGSKFITKVPDGYVAVVYSTSDGSHGTLDPGWHPIGFFEHTQLHSTRLTVVDEKVAVTTKDGKKITVPVKYRMKVDKDKVVNIYKELGSKDVDSAQKQYLYDALFKVSRKTVAKYTVLEIMGTKSEEASDLATTEMAQSVKKMGFDIQSVTYGNPDVDAATQKAIDAKVQAAQEYETEKQKLENAKIIAKKNLIQEQGKADVAIAKAKGEAQSAKVKAEGQAKANKELNNSLTDRILKDKELDARLKHGWITIQGANAVVTTDK